MADPRRNRMQGLAASGGAAPRLAPELAGEELLSAIEEQIIPRLVLAHRSDDDLATICEDTRPPPSQEEIAAFADLAVAQDLPKLLERVEEFMNAGLSLETTLLDLITPAAHCLGDEWMEDRRSFADVGLGLAALQRVVGTLGRDRARLADPAPGSRGLVVLTAAPGESHILAIQVAGELLRAHGWAVHIDPGLQDEELLDLVASEPVVMVGLTVSNTALCDTLGRVVDEVKQASLNSDVVVMLGGLPELSAIAPQVGAVHCPTARYAVEWLERHTARGRDSRPPPS
jgi:methanogenic corrinoid protein MtbC1